MIIASDYPFQKRLARVKQNDPFVTEIDMGHKEFFRCGRDEDVIEMGSVLQKSMHVNRLCLNISRLWSIEGCSTIEEYLKVTKSLRQFNILPTVPPDGPFADVSEKRKLRKKIMDRLLLALQENTCLRELSLRSPLFSSQSLSRFLHTTHSLQVLRLEGTDNSIGFDYNAKVTSKAIQQCHTLQEIELSEFPELWLVFIMQRGLKNHTSLKRLILRESELYGFTRAVAVALQQVLESSTPLQSLQFHFCEFCASEMEPIVKGLMQHPTMESLHLVDCLISDGCEAFKELIESPHEKLQSLNLKGSLTHISIFSALQQSTCLKYLNLGGEYQQDEDTLALVETILRSNPRLMHLSLEQNGIADNEAFVSFMKTVVRDSSLRVLDCGYVEDLDDGFKDLACWTIPQCKECMLQKLFLSTNDLAEKGMEHFVKFLQVHTPRLTSLSFTCDSFTYEEAMQFAEWVRSKSSLMELCLRFHDHLDMLALKEIFAMLRNHHSTLKLVQLDGFNVFDKNLRRMIKMFAETVRFCKLQMLHLEFDVDDNNPDDSDDDSVDEEDSEPDFNELVHAFATNATLTNIRLSDNIINNIPTSNAKKIHFNIVRNKAFQKITSNLTLGGTDRNEQCSEDDEEDDFHVYDNDTFSMVGSSSVSSSGGNDGNASSAIPLSVWPHILEAANKQFPDVSMLYYLLSLPTVSLVLSRREEMDVSSRTSTNEKARSRNNKRGRCSISEE
jgi:hypothetical protein